MKNGESVKKYIEEHWRETIRFNKDDINTLIGLPHPYSVSGFGDVFQEMYYWGTYFTNIGLILSGRVEQAKNNVDNMVYLINRFGFVPNSNRTWGLTRSQPPFLSQMVRDIFNITNDINWLSECYNALKKEYNFWQNERITDCGLNRYSGYYPDTAFLCGRLCARFKMEPPEDKELIEEYAKSFHSGCESGWDFSSRTGLFQHHYAWLCLNSLLYGIEKNMEYFSTKLNKCEEAIWQQRADRRKTLMNETMWNESVGAFCDYNFVEKKTSDLISLAMLYPLFVGLADEKQASKTVENLTKLEFRYGLVCSENKEELYNLQWDYPHAWPPLQLISIKALLRYGYTEQAKRIAQKYLEVADLNFEKYGCLWEKYNGVDGEVSVTKEYKTPPMMGWSAAVYLYCDSIKKQDRTLP
ncbi:MAG: alpha,alpha-trehalase [Ruminococcaceae bacterium]|nr:alpha,alpha-trehalase [Oscillospiraceae bacterium]